ncbi:MAG: cytochrome c biogenesis CcdA family protein [Gemmobacter sp.]
MPEITIIGAAVAGLLSFLSPCVLPMVPFYLSYMAGSSVAELRTPGAGARALRGRLVRRALSFAAGVSAIFMLRVLGSTSAVRVLAEWHGVLSVVAGGALMLLGLHMAGVMRLGFLMRDARFDPGGSAASVGGAFALGLAFGFGWVPCVGPTLAAILFLAAGSGGLAEGVALLAVYGAAMTLPFVLAAAFAPAILTLLARRARLLRHVEVVTGALLVVFGAMVATGTVARVAEAMLAAFDWSATLR